MDLYEEIQERRENSLPAAANVGEWRDGLERRPITNNHEKLEIAVYVTRILNIIQPAIKQSLLRITIHMDVEGNRVIKRNFFGYKRKLNAFNYKKYIFY